MTRARVRRTQPAISFTVMGEPVGQGEPDLGRRGRKAFLYWPEDCDLTRWRKTAAPVVRRSHLKAPHVAFKCWKTVAGKRIPWQRLVNFDGPVIVFAKFYFPQTKTSKEGQVKITAPDLDKLHRGIGDILEANDVLSNDARIVGWPEYPAKFYSDTPRAEITVMAYEED